MDSVFDAQFRTMRDAFLGHGIDIRLAYRPDGEVDYVYQAGRLMTLRSDDRATPDVLSRALPGIRPVPDDEFRPEGLLERLRLWSIEQPDGVRLTVPEALDRLDAEVGRGDGERPLATPVHIVHVNPMRACPAVEPSVPSGGPPLPWPPPRPSAGGRKVVVGVSDTGLLEDAATHPWLAGVDGDPDRLGPQLPGGRHLIPAYAGHGTFIAGVIRSVAPDTDIFVADHFPASGAWLESDVVRSLELLVQRFGPELISLSAGCYTRDDEEPLSFTTFHDAYPDLTIVAAAGNEATDRPFYPAAYDWAIGVGALGTDQVHRAWFSNYGPWVDVYALGEGMVNAYASGSYDYQEPPRRPARQDFDGMARWDGTSFATPLVAGLIAAWMSANPGTSAADAWAALQAQAEAQQLPGVGPALIV